MRKEVQDILSKHGCLHMKDDYKVIFEELDTFYTEKLKVNDFVLDDVIKCEHGNTINPEAHDIIYCRKCWEES